MIFDLSLQGVVLPSQQFFIPTDVFWSILRRLVRQITVVDAGCGVGGLLDSAKDHGITMIGIDVLQRETQHPDVTIANAITYPYDATTWPMICRPCHDVWVEDTITNALRASASAIYVGLPHNYYRDLGDMISADLGEVGEDGEHLYFFQGQQ